MAGTAERRPTLVFLIGPPAVGKMTVGQALACLTGFRLFHLHQVLDLLTDYFPFGTPSFKRLADRMGTAYIESFSLTSTADDGTVEGIAAGAELMILARQPVVAIPSGKETESNGSHLAE